MYSHGDMILGQISPPSIDQELMRYYVLSTELVVEKCAVENPYVYFAYYGLYFN